MGAQYSPLGCCDIRDVSEIFPWTLERLNSLPSGTSYLTVGQGTCRDHGIDELVARYTYPGERSCRHDP